MRVLLTAVSLFVLLPATAAAAEATPNRSGLQVVDWLIIAVYAAATIGLGAWFGRRQKNTDEYFVGSGKMHPGLIGVSLFASLLSTITYLSIPGETIGKGPVYLTNYIAYPFIYLVVGYVLLPVYMKQRVTSAYELLEERLGVSVRILGASMFLVLRLVWMSILTFLTSMAIAEMIGLDESYIPWIVLFTGAVAITYASLGGLRAVVITDLMQTILLYGGAVLTIAIVTWRMGGFGWFPSEWNSTWDTQPLVSLDPATRITVLGTFLSVFLWTVCTSGGDQVSIQRFMATRDAASARRAIGIQLAVGCVVGITLGLAGFALLGFYQANPDQLPGELLFKDGNELAFADGLKQNADKVFPRFIAYGLPPIVSGLVLSGLFAAAMSSIDSGVNSITAVVSRDFVARFRRTESDSGTESLAFARVLAVAIGVAVVLLGTLFSRFENPDNITALTNKTVNLLTVPIFCLFFFALFVPFARPAGVWAGAIAGTTVAALIAFSGFIFGPDPETGLDPISFQWIGPSALVADITVGCAVSLLFGGKTLPGNTGRPAEETDATQ